MCRGKIERGRVKKEKKSNPIYININNEKKKKKKTVEKKRILERQRMG